MFAWKHHGRLLMAESMVCGATKRHRVVMQLESPRDLVLNLLAKIAVLTHRQGFLYLTRPSSLLRAIHPYLEILKT